MPRPRAVAGVVLYDLARPGPDDVTWNGRFRSTSVARTALDLAVRQLKAQPDAVIAHLLDAFAAGNYAAAGVPLRL